MYDLTHITELHIMYVKSHIVGETNVPFTDMIPVLSYITVRVYRTLERGYV